MHIVKAANITNSYARNKMIGYRPGWRGGRRDIGAPRCTSGLNPPDLPFDLGDLPPDD